MNTRMTISSIAACAALTSCGGTTSGTPVTESASAPTQNRSSEASAPTSTLGLDVSPPQAAIANPNVTGTTFDGCAVVTKTDEATWELVPVRKRDLSDDGPAGSEGARGCYWDAKKWQLRVYAINGSIAEWTHKYGEKYDRLKQQRFGNRDGLVAHQAAPFLGCIVLVPSQQGLAGVALIPGFDLQDQGFDACPTAEQIMNTVESRIP